jgi:hypothetical protein
MFRCYAKNNTGIQTSAKEDDEGIIKDESFFGERSIAWEFGAEFFNNRIFYHDLCLIVVVFVSVKIFFLNPFVYTSRVHPIYHYTIVIVSEFRYNPHTPPYSRGSYNNSPLLPTMLGSTLIVILPDCSPEFRRSSISTREISPI